MLSIGILESKINKHLPKSNLNFSPVKALTVASTTLKALNNTNTLYFV